MNPLIYAVPFYLSLMLVEYLIARKSGKSVYSWKGTVGNLLCGIGHVFVESLTKLPVILLYVWTAGFALDIQHNGWTKWFMLFVLIDFIFYFSHLLSHKVGWMWAIHGVHHQSEDYNFSVGLRQAWLHKLTAFWTPLPLAILGFALEDYILVLVIHSSLQIWTHTKLFSKRMPLIEWLIVTPSHHRVHHGKNAQYIDKNFSGLISIWDYIFGTYEAENEPVKFGVHGIKERVNPFSSNFIMFAPKLWQPLPKIRSVHTFKSLCRTILAVVLCLGYFLVEYKIEMWLKLSLVFILLMVIVALGWREDHPSPDAQTHPT